VVAVHTHTQACRPGRHPTDCLTAPPVPSTHRLKSSALCREKSTIWNANSRCRGGRNLMEGMISRAGKGIGKGCGCKDMPSFI
jgi:hypothetical protein